MQKSSSLILSRPARRWTRLTQLVSLNTPGYANGVLILYANDTLALAQTGIVYRTSEDVTLKNVLFSTFFGGSDNTWDSTGGDAYFRNFAVRSPSPPSCQIPVGQEPELALFCRSGTAQTRPTRPVQPSTPPFLLPAATRPPVLRLPPLRRLRILDPLEDTLHLRLVSAPSCCLYSSHFAFPPEAFSDSRPRRTEPPLLRLGGPRSRTHLFATVAFVCVMFVGSHRRMTPIFVARPPHRFIGLLSSFASPL